MSSPRKASPAPRSPKPAPRAAEAPALSFEELKTLVSLIAKEPIQEFELEATNLRFRIRKDGVAPSQPAPAPQLLVPALPTQSVVAPTAPAPVEGEPEEAGLHYITCPIVGTFYRAPNPNAPLFVQVGDMVRPGQTLCIVEAMKLMNEIECDSAGELVKILVENGQPVEYGERLFAIRPR